MTQPVIEALDIVRILGEGAWRVEALRGINLSLRGGELTLLMGPSGSGKTTLLSVLGCILSPTRGTVRILGHPTAGAGPEELAALRRQHVGFIFQSYHLFPTLTAVENVRLVLDVRGERSRRARAKANEALAAVGLSHKVRSFPRELSGGEQQRVAIARALVTKPELVVADEPTGNLDSKTGQTILDLLRQLNTDRQLTIILVTHSPVAAAYGNRTVELRDGRIVRDGATPPAQTDLPL